MIGVFDSGLGGLTVVKEIIRLMPTARILYFGDTAHLPYGEKSEEIIKKYTLAACNFLKKRKVKIIVIACHSASSVALDYVKSKISLPVIGVIETGVKTALKKTKNKRIGVIGTRITIKSGAYERVFKNYDKEIEIIARATPLLVPLVEEGWINHPITKEILKIYLEPLKEEEIDTLLLGCTHYPLLKKTIEEIFRNKITIVDSAEELAKSIVDFFDYRKIKRIKGELIIYLTDIPPEFERVARNFLGFSPDKIMRVALQE
ncbi:MAG: glutamate racemase [candidate division WOR-3 bacterium]|nr:glutamate racemase [candidate division WOR-3 bacterium]MCX7836557.1 glutamate racemase [candidate division WOR-3 bacterium]MDW8113902.1 glutamate racemase [candidate division WOR-3 bacterium]